MDIRELDADDVMSVGYGRRRWIVTGVNDCRQAALVARGV